MIGDAGCGDLIQDSVSCMHTREQTIEQPHCGRCSQCVSRRFAALASRYAASDPGNQYKVDLLTGERFPDKDLTLVESFIRFATQVGGMNELQIVERFGEVGRILRHLRPLSSNQVAERIVQLHRRHSSEVARVMDAAISAHAADIREEKLPKTCAIILAVPEAYRVTAASVQTGGSHAEARNGDAKPRGQSRNNAGVGPRNAGRKPDADGNRRIAQVLEPFGTNWRDQLAAVCESLDAAKIPLRQSEKWQNQGCSDWTRGNRLGCKLRFDDGSLLFILDSQITPEIEQFISSFGPPTAQARPLSTGGVPTQNCCGQDATWRWRSTEPEAAF
jgi:hypothetical protein